MTNASTVWWIVSEDDVLLGQIQGPDAKERAEARVADLLKRGMHVKAIEVVAPQRRRAKL